jgi:hypothetical protein
LLRPLHADHEARAARADDAQRAAIIQVVGGECQRIQHREALAIVQYPSQDGTLLPDGDVTLIARAADLDIDNARLGFLPQPLGRAAAPRQHVMRGNRRMTHESRLGARREEPGTQVMIGPVGRQDERGIGVIELARDGEHLALIETVGIQDHARRIAREGRACERIDLMNLNCAH